MFREWVGKTNRFLAVFIVTGTLFLSGCLPEKSESIEPKAFFEELNQAGIDPQNLDPESSLTLTNAIKGYYPLGVYVIKETELALFDLPSITMLASNLITSPIKICTFFLRSQFQVG